MQGATFIQFMTESFKFGDPTESFKYVDALVI